MTLGVCAIVLSHVYGCLMETPDFFCLFYFIFSLFVCVLFVCGGVYVWVCVWGWGVFVCLFVFCFLLFVLDRVNIIFVCVCRFYESTVSWTTARDSCVGLSAYLVSINTQSENDFVAFLSAGLSNNQGDRTWLGLGPDYHAQNPKTWLDGTTVSYTNWVDGEPNNNNGNEGCIEMNWDGRGLWNDHDCNEEKQYICEKVWIV